MSSKHGLGTVKDVDKEEVLEDKGDTQRRNKEAVQRKCVGVWPSSRFGRLQMLPSLSSCRWVL